MGELSRHLPNHNATATALTVPFRTLAGMDDVIHLCDCLSGPRPRCMHLSPSWAYFERGGGGGGGFIASSCVRKGPLPDIEQETITP